MDVFIPPDFSPSLLVNSLMQQGDISESELAEIKKLIRKKEKKNG
jgi:hypothetical protein